MANKKLSDAEAKSILLRWPNRTKTVWPPPGGKGFWLRAQPVVKGAAAGPRISAPGATLFRTQPDGMWIHFNGHTSCDVVAIEVCGTIQNLNDKRSRYMPSSHSLVLTLSKAWAEELVAYTPRGKKSRIDASVTLGPVRDREISIPVRHLRVMYALPNEAYSKWAAEHSPTGYEYFVPHSSLDSYTSQAMQRFLRRMSIESQFYLGTNRKA